MRRASRASCKQKSWKLRLKSEIGQCSRIGTWFALECRAQQRGIGPWYWENHEEDRMMKTISALTAAMVFAAFTTAFAQAPAPEPIPAPAPTQDMMSPPAPEPAPVPSMGEEKKADKPMKGGQSQGKAKGHAKKTSKKRGLDRADAAAGQHGKQGRDKARAHQ